MVVLGAKLSNPVNDSITFLGDSQTHGPGWVDTLEASVGRVAHNEGQSGAKVGWALGFDKNPTDGTTPSTLMSLPDVWSRRKSGLYVVWYGINDAFPGYLGVETPESVREQTFRERLTQVCKICTYRGGQVALLATQQYPSEYDPYVERNDRTDRYDAIKVEIAAALPGVHYIPETGYLLEADEFLGANDLHFSAAGHTRQAAVAETGLDNAGLLGG